MDVARKWRGPVTLKRLAWLTDIHLDHAGRSQTSALWAAVRDAGADAVLLGGDISTAPGLERHLLELRDSCGVAVYFVLGNHDCYGGSIAGARAIARRLTEQHDGLTWLGAVDVVALTERTALIGHDGWGDGGFGNAATSPVILNDFLMIDELRLPRRSELLRELERLGIEAAEHLGRTAAAAARDYQNLLVLTHVPPFAEAAWHEGRQSNPDWLPFFACRAAGEALSEVAASCRCRMTVLCGHTHGGGRCEIGGISVITGSAEYGFPRIQQVIEVR